MFGIHEQSSSPIRSPIGSPIFSSSPVRSSQGSPIFATDACISDNDEPTDRSIFTLDHSPMPAVGTLRSPLGSLSNATISSDNSLDEDSEDDLDYILGNELSSMSGEDDLDYTLGNELSSTSGEDHMEDPDSEDSQHSALEEPERDHNAAIVNIPRTEALAKTSAFLVKNLLQFQGCMEHGVTSAEHQKRRTHREHLTTTKADDDMASIPQDQIHPTTKECTMSMITSKAGTLLECGQMNHIFEPGKLLDPTRSRVSNPSKVFRALCTGTISSEESAPDTCSESDIPVCLSLALSSAANDDLRSMQVNTVYDIDSVVCVSSSLSVAKRGLRFISYPIQPNNIKSDLHIKLDVTVSEGVTQSLKIHKIPHFQLGFTEGFFNLSLLVFFPRLYRKNQQSTFPREDIIREFMDIILLPSIRRVVPNNVSQHYPFNFEHGKAKAKADSLETQSKVDYKARTQLLQYFIAPQYLEQIWETCQLLTDELECHHFRDMKLLINGKNLKLKTKSTGALLCFEEFRSLWDMNLDVQFLNPRLSWIDYGKECLSSKDGDTYLWRTCCLQSIAIQQRKASGMKKGGFKVSHYFWGLTADAGNMTIEPTNSKNPMRRAGLMYSQYYSSTKEILDAGKTYPFDNDALEYLAVDTKISDMQKSAGAAIPFQRPVLQRAYITSRDRCLQSLGCTRGTIIANRITYGVREEHRVTFELLYEWIVPELQRTLLEPEQPLSDQNLHSAMMPPYFVIPTQTTRKFMLFNILRFAYPFEWVLSMYKPDDIPYDTTLFLFAMLKMLRACAGADLLVDKSAIWRRMVSKEDGSRHFGLGLRDSLNRYGFGWIATDRIDWNKFQFLPEVAPTLFNDRQLVSMYKKRVNLVGSLTQTIREVEESLSLLQHIQNGQLRSAAVNQRQTKSHAYHLIFDWYNHELIYAFRRDIWCNFADTQMCCDPEEWKSCRSGSVALTVSNLKRYTHPENYPWRFAKHSNRYPLNAIAKLRYIWDFNDGEVRRWDRKGWRTLFQSCHNNITSVLGPESAKCWKDRFFATFLRYNWTFPHPPANSFNQTTDGSYLWHSAVHESVKGRLNMIQDDEMHDVCDLTLGKWNSGRTPGAYIRGRPPAIPYLRFSRVKKQVFDTVKNESRPLTINSGRWFEP